METELNLIALIRNRDLLNTETVEDLRDYIAHHPYDQTARLLLLENLYRLHSAEFGEELRRQATLINRASLFDMVEGGAYEINHELSSPAEQPEPATDRTLSLIDGFLGTLPEADKKSAGAGVDASQDYVAYLLRQEKQSPAKRASSARHTKSRKPAQPVNIDSEEPPLNEEFFTETLAHVYIKQGKYERALEIIRRLSADNPSNSSYFADQIRHLEQLIELNKNKEEDV